MGRLARHWKRHTGAPGINTYAAKTKGQRRARWLPPPATGPEIETWVLLRVERFQGGRVSWGQALARTLLKLLPWELTHMTLLLPAPIWADPQPGFRLGLVLVYGLLAAYLAAALLTPRRQTLPDLITGTVVIETKETIE
jgi:hypothetical protein